MADIKFIAGMQYYDPPATAPDYVKGKISIKVKEFFAFAEQHQNSKGWLNIDVKVSQKGIVYFALNEYKPKTSQEIEDEKLKQEIAKAEAVPVVQLTPEDSEIPF